MTLQLAPITSAILSLAWQGDSGTTYTLQTSNDLGTWETLPYVVEGSGMDESYFLEQVGRETFVRLRYDLDGDTDDNGLPDMWEWQHFGEIGVSPEDDPDLDGLSNAIEWMQQTDPNDYYNGDWPVIELSCGTDWLVPAGQESIQNLSFSLTGSSGEPWCHAPVFLEMAPGTGWLVSTHASGSVQAKSLLVWTDGSGRFLANPFSVHVVASATGGSIDRLTIKAGKADTGIRIHSIADGFGPPPRELTRWTSSEGDAFYSWTGDPAGAESILIEERDASGNWQQVIEVATAELPPPAGEEGVYTIQIGN